MILMLLLALIFLLVLPAISHAKGGGSYTAPAVAEKSENLVNLENQFYNLANMTMGAYMNPSYQTASMGKGGDTLMLSPDGSVTKTSPLGRVISSLKGNPISGTVIPQPYDKSTMMGQLFNDATKKTYVANQQYDNLVQQAPQYTKQSQDALASSKALLGQGADAVNMSKTAGDKYFNQADDMYADSAKYMRLGGDVTNQARTAGDPWYDKAMGAYDTAGGLLGDLRNNLAYGRESNQWYDDYTKNALTGAQNLMDTGKIPQPIMDAMMSAMTSGVNQSVGSSINDLASRGVINSSVANRGLSDASRAVSDSMNSNYLNALSTLLGGYQGNATAGADAGRTFADINLDYNNSLYNAVNSATDLGAKYGSTGSQRVSDLLGVAGMYNDLSGAANTNANSLMGAGSQRISDWLNIGKGYNDSAAGYGTLSDSYLKQLDSNLKEREGLQNDLSQYYINAAAPMMPAYDLLKTMQQDHWNSDKQDTVVKQGK